MYIGQTKTDMQLVKLSHRYYLVDSYYDVVGMRGHLTIEAALDYIKSRFNPDLIISDCVKSNELTPKQIEDYLSQYIYA